MYLYVYDSFVADKRHERLLARTETRLTDLGISGRIERLTMFKDLGEIVGEAVRRGCETVVAVGNDATIGRLIDAIAEHDVSLGIIPVGEGPHGIADMLGVVPDIEACNILSRRVTQTIDLGRINDHWFLSSVEIPRTMASISCDNGKNGRYSIIPTEENQVRVCNLAAITVGEEGDGRISSPRDGYLEMVTRPVPRNGFFSKLFRGAPAPVEPGTYPVRDLHIRHQAPFTVIRDGQRLSSNSLHIEIVPKKLKVITGKGRKFE